MVIVVQPGKPLGPPPPPPQNQSLLDLINSMPQDAFIKHLDSIVDSKLTSTCPVDGSTLLHKACLRSSPLIVNACLHKGLDVNVGDRYGRLPIHLAANRHSLLVLKLLALSGARMDAIDCCRRSALHYAVAGNNTSGIAWLIKQLGPVSVTWVDSQGQTSLHVVCALGNRLTLTCLFDCLKRTGVDNHVAASLASSLDTNGNSCLHTLLLGDATNGSTSSSNSSFSVSRRANEMIWPLLTWAPTRNFGSQRSMEPPFLPLVLHRNKLGQTPLDIASPGLSQRVIFLLTLSQFLVKHCSSTSAARCCLLAIYSLSFLLHFLAPFLISTLALITSLLVTPSSSSPWPFYLASALILTVASYQQHRLQDGTNRANPFFLGLLLTGLSVAFGSLLILVPGNSSLFVRTLYLGMLYIPSCIALLAIWRLLASDQLAINRSDRVTRNLDELLDREASQLLEKRGQLSSVLYCPYCDVTPAITNQTNCGRWHKLSGVKHCKLCQSCRVDLDHHCLFIMQCVTRSNQLTFIVLLGSLLAQALFLLTVTLTGLVNHSKCWSRSHSDDPLNSFLSTTWCVAVEQHAYLFILSLAAIGFGFWIFELLLTQLASYFTWSRHLLFYLMRLRDKAQLLLRMPLILTCTVVKKLKSIG